ncbi:MAG: hypothetical protein CSA40_00065 [Flavobacteriales bacterium]|nr:MAG: hypothetical protein CSA40_00065 [Flavobacteriales bacterium]
MRHYFFYLIILFVQTAGLMAQDSLLIGKPYLEDQLYFGITYNHLLNKQEVISQNGLSLGLQAGFIKDIPLNRNRNKGLAIGLGYEYSKFQSNLLPQDQTFSLVGDFNKNKFETHSITIPFEFRFRTSNDHKYKFWRVYIGGKVSYVLYSRAVFVNSEQSIKTSIPYLNPWQAGPQIALGYNAFNAYFFWNIIPVFQGAPVLDNAYDPNKLTFIKMGLQFYIF